MFNYMCSLLNLIMCFSFLGQGLKYCCVCVCVLAVSFKQEELTLLARAVNGTAEVQPLCRICPVRHCAVWAHWPVLHGLQVRAAPVAQGVSSRASGFVGCCAVVEVASPKLKA